MRRRKADDFHVFQSGFAASGENVVFGDVLLAFGINDPKRGCAFHRFGDFWQSAEIFLRIRSEKDPFRIGCNFALAHGLGEPAYFREKSGIEVTEQRNFRIGLHPELFDS